MTKLSVPSWNDPRGFAITARSPRNADWEDVTLTAPCGCECTALRWRSPSAGYSSGVTTECELHGPALDIEDAA